MKDKVDTLFGYIKNLSEPDLDRIISLVLVQNKGERRWQVSKMMLATGKYLVDGLYYS